MDVKNFTKNGDFRTLKEGTLLRLVEGGQPVVFEGIDERPASHASDMAVVICLDPVEGLTRLRYPLQDESNYINRFEGADGERIGHESEEGKKYLKLITIK